MASKLRVNASAWLWGVGVALSASALMIPVVRHGAMMPPDVIEHLAIANAWSHGQGFVDPIQYYFYLTDSPPVAAFAVRAPLVPMLLAVPLSLGLGLESMLFCHALFAIAVVTACYVLMLRFMSPPAAAAAALAATSTISWLVVAATPLTEVAASLLIVAVIATAGRARTGVGPAFLCAALTWLGWLARPNLGVMVVAVGLAMALQLGARAALRHRPLQVYLGAFTMLFAATHLAVTAMTGLAPYEGYGVAAEHIGGLTFAVYGKTYVGAASFIADHLGDILAVAWRRIGQLLTALFVSPDHNRLGLLLLIGLVHSAVRWSRTRFEQRLCVIAFFAFTAAIVGNYARWDATRFPILPLLVGLMASFMALDALARQRARRLDLDASRIRRGLTMIACLIFGLVTLRAVAVQSDLQPRGELPQTPSSRLARLPPIARVCRLLEPDARVATDQPWQLHLYCGNAAIIVPVDVDRPGVWERFVAEREPAYLVESPSRASRSGVVEVGRAGGLVVYAVSDPAPGSRPWHAAPPLICAGADPICEDHADRRRLRAFDPARAPRYRKPDPRVQRRRGEPLRPD